MEHFIGRQIKETETADSRVDILFPHSENEECTGGDRFQTEKADSGDNLEAVEGISQKI